MVKEIIKPKKTVQKMKKYNRQPENRKNKIRLDLNENIRGCSPKVIEKFKKISYEDVSFYPEYDKFIKKSASYIKVKTNQILVTNGTDDAIKTILETYLDKNDEVIIPAPIFSMFEIYASLIGAKKKVILYNEDLSFPTKKILSSINSKTRLIVIVNPNNPTGTIIAEEDIIKIVKKAKNSIVLIDEAYFQFSKKSSKDLIQKYENVIITQTFSKAFGLAGLRLGYIIANKNRIKELEKVILPYAVNSLSIIAGSAAIDDKEFVKKYVKEVNRNKKFITIELKKLNIKVVTSGANFLIAYFGDKCKLVIDELKLENILIRDVSSYPLLEGYLRIGIGTSEQCKKLVSVIKSVLKKDVILFDMDGVLVDVSKSYRFAIKSTVEYFTKQRFNLDEIQKYKEKSGFNNDWDLTEAILLDKKFKIPKKEIIRKFQEFYLGNKKNKGFLENEKWLLSKTILNNLNKNYKLGIVTGRPKNEAFYILKKSKVLDFFDVVITMEDIPKGKGKPNPYGINLALDKLETSSAIYVGDSLDDLIAAKKAGLEFIGILPKNIPISNLKKFFKKKNADKIVNNINRIVDVI